MLRLQKCFSHNSHTGTAPRAAGEMTAPASCTAVCWIDPASSEHWVARCLLQDFTFPVSATGDVVCGLGVCARGEALSLIFAYPTTARVPDRDASGDGFALPIIDGGSCHVANVSTPRCIWRQKDRGTYIVDAFRGRVLYNSVIPPKRVLAICPFSGIEPSYVGDFPGYVECVDGTGAIYTSPSHYEEDTARKCRIWVQRPQDLGLGTWHAVEVGDAYDIVHPLPQGFIVRSSQSERYDYIATDVSPDSSVTLFRQRLPEDVRFSLPALKRALLVYAREVSGFDGLTEVYGSSYWYNATSRCVGQWLPQKSLYAYAVTKTVRETGAVTVWGFVDIKFRLSWMAAVVAFAALTGNSW